MHKQINAAQPLLTMDESLFYQLLEGPGKVEVSIAMLHQYYVPLVSFYAEECAQGIEYGAIVRNKTDVLAAESVAELITELDAMTGRPANLTVLRTDAPTHARRD